jgi:predicted transposase YdaD
LYNTSNIDEKQKPVLENFLKIINQEDKTMGTLAQKWIDEGRTKGINIGKAEGITEGISIGEARGISIGEARGISIGEAAGKAEGKTELIKLMVQNGNSVDTISKMVNMPADEIKKLIKP